MTKLEFRHSAFSTHRVLVTARVLAGFGPERVYSYTQRVALGCRLWRLRRIVPHSAARPAAFGEPGEGEKSHFIFVQECGVVRRRV